MSTPKASNLPLRNERDSSLRFAWLAAIVVVTLACATACGSQLTIHLEASSDLNGVAPPFVKIDVTELGKPTKDFGPFSIDSVPNANFVKVPPGQPFFLDVIGCKTGDAGTKSTCPDDKPDTFIARGCTTFFALQKDEAKDVTIVVHNVAVGNTKCPPPPPP